MGWTLDLRWALEALKASVSSVGRESSRPTLGNRWKGRSDKHLPGRSLPIALIEEKWKEVKFRLDKEGEGGSVLARIPGEGHE